MAVAVFALLLVGCPQKEAKGSPQYADAITLTVSVASSLTEPFEELRAAFAESFVAGDLSASTTSSVATPQIYANYGSSNALATQIMQGAHVDIFITADSALFADLQARGLLVGEPSIIGTNSLVFAFLPSVDPLVEGNFSATGGLQHLISFVVEQNISVATGNPESVPLGRYAKAAVGEFWDVLSGQLVFAKNANTARYYLLSEAVDAAILYSSDRMQLPAGTTVYELPSDMAVQYFAGIITSDEVRQDNAGQGSADGFASQENATARQEAIEAYLDFLQSPRGVEILQKYGIGVPASTAGLVKPAVESVDALELEPVAEPVPSGEATP